MLDWVTGRPVRAIRALWSALRRLVDQPRSRAIVLAALVVLLVLAVVAAARFFGSAADAVRGVRERALVVAIVAVAAVFGTVLTIGSAREARLVADAELERYCRAFAESRSLSEAAKFYRSRLESGDFEAMLTARSHIPSLIR